MIPWVQVYSNLTTHPKTARLAQELKLQSQVTSPPVIATGIIVSIWLWAIQNAYSGDLSNVPDDAIADACRWKKDPRDLIEALIAAGFVDPDRKLHSWENYAILLMDAEDNRREKTRERVQRYRSKRNDSKNAEENKPTNGDCNAGVTVTQTLQERYGNALVRECNAATIPNQTIPIILESSCANASENATEKRVKTSEVNANFEQFWAAYPKKKSKATALKAFQKIRDVPLETMLAALEVQKRSRDWLKGGGQYIPYPATWLNQRRFEDEEAISVSTRGLPPEYYECGDGESL